MNVLQRTLYAADVTAYRATAHYVIAHTLAALILARKSTLCLKVSANASVRRFSSEPSVSQREAKLIFDNFLQPKRPTLTHPEIWTGTVERIQYAIPSFGTTTLPGIQPFKCYIKELADTKDTLTVVVIGLLTEPCLQAFTGPYYGRFTLTINAQDKETVQANVRWLGGGLFKKKAYTRNVPLPYVHSVFTSQPPRWLPIP